MCAGDLWGSQEAGHLSGAREMPPRALTLAPSPVGNHRVGIACSWVCPPGPVGHLWLLVAVLFT